MADTAGSPCRPTLPQAGEAVTRRMVDKIPVVQKRLHFLWLKRLQIFGSESLT